ncbi:MAG TPA: carbohydrate ABC transporter permease [Candidatus Ornithocaccomicrobium faecavium]|uniref:Carbohydrate ABC transporter permease n=1 Tax=Candidatus Ornithocaccomicrobium faecavium TaxID=2840890 RepID=A0A9D1P7A5_9FIRM|nr:carbohydrate ABC transporter permease [Clostridiales bacterium]HIV27396.1 carbohydrate ABC transporter permease [Candidatus Ornithocaccomicrobium faecavium]
MKQTRASIFSRQSTGDRVFEIVNTALLALILLVILYPLWFVVIASVSDPAKVVAGDVLLWPAGVSFEAYRMVFRDSMIMTGYRNTLYYTLLGTAINLVMTVLAAYPLSRKDWVGRGFFMALVMFTMFFSGGTIPTYLLMNDLGLINTTWALVLPGAVSVYNAIVMRTFFINSIPLELQEAAQVDGCSNTRLLLRIVLPLSKPILAVMVLFYGVAHWNAFFGALIYITESDRYPLQLVLRSILIQNTASQDMLGEVDTLGNRVMLAETIKYALIIVSTLPMMVLYPFLQRFFEKGVMVGSVKG